jgi:hypothetical protein
VEAQADKLGPVVTVEKYGFSFQPPKDWKKAEDPEPKWISTKQVDGIWPNLNIASTPTFPGEFQANVDLIIDQINKGGGELKVNDTLKIEINGRQARFLYGQIPGDGFTFKTLQVIFNGPQEYLILTYIINDKRWEEFKPIYESSAKTAVFK